ncbi:glycosyltransferase family 2 protein [Marinilabilia salmonicolor]|jgi:glycosyltransferase involved in cell wall biosynthesis|uniref:Glycosyltransferase involved in cell wall biosynthesis n=1 Tax=Marinilabilia salmonicolor TaxID=989 RepID=A0A2T0XEQ7_9BACT|nr:glycosyltransferase family 2 protein [Marinilabilia salmonicolor]PRY97405.1 glycosyltransferase involved in cell wall biosynthesis [Marinilabilia salmonicolor]RCW35366.1 glycosyltransferase involved in cell wall biosynthesis [Marinilabilia salmonicolor]
MELSVVVPFLNEEESLPELIRWIERVCSKMEVNFEVVVVDDGSTDHSWEVVKELKREFDFLIGLRFRRNYGKSAALNKGFEAAQGDVVITMDADLQDSPDEIPELYALISKDGYDLVSGWKKKRHDPLNKTLPSKLFNRTARIISGIKLHDFNCGLKAYRNEVVKNIEVYGEMHRYIPILAKRAGFYKITEKVVNHRERKYGVTKFGIERFMKGFLDLLSVMFISKFGNRPMHLFGALGTLMFFIGFGLAIWLGAHKLYCVAHGVVAPLVTSNPFFYIGLVCMILGTQLFVTGFLAELVSRNRPDRNEYSVSEKF